MAGKTKDRQRAEDILQDTYLKAILQFDIGKYVETGSMKYWLLQIANRLFIDECRREKRQSRPLRMPEGSDEDGYAEYISSFMSDDMSAENVLIKREIKNSIAAAVRKLPKEQKTVFLLRYRLGLPFKDIAESTKSNINTAVGRMRWALIHLRKNGVMVV